MNRNSPAIKRILADVRELGKHPSSRYHAAPLEDNMFEWHFTIRGSKDTDFEGGLYHGRILLPLEYPFKPPNIIFLNKNGRFEVGTKICLSISAYHVETWQPAWGIRTMLEAIISFLPTAGAGAIGALDWTKAERQALAAESHSFCCPTCGAIKDLITMTEEEEAGGSNGGSGAVDETILAQVKQLGFSAVSDPTVAASAGPVAAGSDVRTGTGGDISAGAIQPSVSHGSSPAPAPIAVTTNAESTPTKTFSTPGASAGIGAGAALATPPQRLHQQEQEATTPATPYYPITPGGPAVIPPPTPTTMASMDRSSGNDVSSSSSGGADIEDRTHSPQTAAAVGPTIGSPAPAPMSPIAQSRISGLDTSSSPIDDADGATAADNLPAPSSQSATASNATAPTASNRGTTDYVDLVYVVAMAVVAFLIAFLLARKYLPQL